MQKKAPQGRISDAIASIAFDFHGTFQTSFTKKKKGKIYKGRKIIKSQNFMHIGLTYAFYDELCHTCLGFLMILSS